jgi:hypothetical protein
MTGNDRVELELSKWSLHAHREACGSMAADKKNTGPRDCKG